MTPAATIPNEISREVLGAQAELLRQVDELVARRLLSLSDTQLDVVLKFVRASRGSPPEMVQEAVRSIRQSLGPRPAPEHAAQDID